MSEYVLEAINVTKEFPGVKALDNVQLNLRKGEILGLIGENGAGKSTILKILNGLFPYGTYEGEVKINGEVVQFKSPFDSHNKGIGYVPQEINVLDRLSLAENIYIEDLRSSPKSPFVSYKKINENATMLMRKLGLNMDANTKVSQLSTAEKQLLMIARALSKDVPILILDEPTTALTVDETKKLFDILRGIRANGTSIIFVTHKLDEIWEMTDRVTVFRDGHYISTSERENYNEADIIRDMVGRTIDVMYPARESNIGDEILRVEDITVAHPLIENRNVIEGVSFSLHRGEVLGLAGLMGAGRTEVIRAIYGSLRLKRGKIFINGEEARIRSESDAVKNGLNMVTEDRKKDGLLMINDIERNISVTNLKAIKKYGITNARIERKRSEHFKQLMRIKANSVESKVVSLSGGNQQKVLIAKALNTDPQIILLDEPTKGIDVGSKSEIYALINELVARGISVIMVSSELPELLAMCDRFLVLNEGRLVGELSKEEVSQDKIMKLCIS